MQRRRFLRRTLGAAASAAAWRSGPAFAGQAPAIVRGVSGRLSLPQGVAVGQIGGTSALVWSRAERPARMSVEYATTDRFDDARRVRGPSALESSDFTARVVLTDLPPGQRIVYRVVFEDLADARVSSEPEQGSFLTAPAPGIARDITIAFSADTVGQGWGINPEWGGLRLYDTMRRAQPDVFINLGDTIYADQPVPAEVRLDDGTIWKNLVTPAKSKVAETLDDFRGCYQYNLLDEHMRRFNRDVSQVVVWDDHEVRDNWFLERDLSDDGRYAVKSLPLLSARARQAFGEYHPIPLSGDDPDRVYRTIPYGEAVEIFALDMRSYRGPNSANRQTRLDAASALLGSAQVAAIKARLAASRAVWKVIASDMPIGLAVPDVPARFDAVANGDDGPPLGRELEIADLLRFIRDRRILNVVWITADVHYCAAHHYDPARARFTAFDPFWEFVAGPLNAGTFGPNALDATFGPELKFIGIPPGMAPNRPPSDGLQFFGTLRIDGRTRVLTARLHDLSGRTLYSVDLESSRAR